jgi:hypothetical protein
MTSTPLEDFYLPSPEELNITTTTNYTWGYNPWMEEYSHRSVLPERPIYVMLAGACLPEEEGGSESMGDMSIGWNITCASLNMYCQCRPIVKTDKWNTDTYPSTDIYQGLHHCSWETRRVLDEHRKGLVKLAGVSTRCGMVNGEIYDEARELGVPIFVTDMNPPVPG